MKTIVLASNNKNKIKEFKDILPDYDIKTLEDIEFFDEIEETGKTFFENALIKAETIHNYLKEKNLDYIVISDDSGLCATALNGEPGVYSARYSGKHGDDKGCREKLIKNLEGKDKEAYFVCNIVVYYPDGTYKSFEGKTYGEILDKERGNNGFGYDSIFLSRDLGKSFGEVSNEEKNKVSHRYRAIKAMLEEL